MKDRLGEILSHAQQLGPKNLDELSIAIALSWFAECSGNPQMFWTQIEEAKQAYMSFFAQDSGRERIPAWDDLGENKTAAYFAQAISLIDGRAACDWELVSQVAPWLVQLGSNIPSLLRVKGAQARARRMLLNTKDFPDTAMFELVMAGNYAEMDFQVSFIEEGKEKSPDLELIHPVSGTRFVVELKRLRASEYELNERNRHREIFQQVEALIRSHSLSVDIDVTYAQELSKVPVDYLANVLLRYLSSPIVLVGDFQWKDEFGSGTIRDADLAAVRQDLKSSYLFLGPKLARLLSGRVVPENNYHLATSTDRNPEAPRYVDTIYFGSVVTWKSSSPEAIRKKVKHVSGKLGEADKQILKHGPGWIHVAMDTDVDIDLSDFRLRRNFDAVLAHRPQSDTRLVFLHYFVRRVTEHTAWLIDETVYQFGGESDELFNVRAFPGAEKMKNGLPAWKQVVDL